MVILFGQTRIAPSGNLTKFQVQNWKQFWSTCSNLNAESEFLSRHELHLTLLLAGQNCTNGVTTSPPPPRTTTISVDSNQTTNHAQVKSPRSATVPSTEDNITIVSLEASILVYDDTTNRTNINVTSKNNKYGGLEVVDPPVLGTSPPPGHATTTYSPQVPFFFPGNLPTGFHPIMKPSSDVRSTPATTIGSFSRIWGRETVYFPDDIRPVTEPFNGHKETSPITGSPSTNPPDLTVLPIVEENETSSQEMGSSNGFNFTEANVTWEGNSTSVNPTEPVNRTESTLETVGPTTSNNSTDFPVGSNVTAQVMNTTGSVLDMFVNSTSGTCNNSTTEITEESAGNVSEFTKSTVKVLAAEAETEVNDGGLDSGIVMIDLENSTVGVDFVDLSESESTDVNQSVPVDATFKPEVDITTTTINYRPANLSEYHYNFKFHLHKNILFFLNF